MTDRTDERRKTAIPACTDTVYLFNVNYYLTIKYSVITLRQRIVYNDDIPYLKKIKYFDRHAIEMVGRCEKTIVAEYLVVEKK